jgi:hypothetical protein
MNPDDLRSFAGRDWGSVEREKRRYWMERKQALSPAQALAIAESLRLHVRGLRPDWPSAAERLEDAGVHSRVSASLRLVR